MSDFIDSLAYLSALPPPEDLQVRRAQRAQWMWATVTQVSPLRVRLDGESQALDMTPVSLVGMPLIVNDRVWCQLIEKQLVVHGTSRAPMLQSGRVLVSASGGIGTATVTFPRPFPAVPVIVATGHSGVAALQNVQVTDPSTTGFTMVVQRTSTTETTCYWIATL